MDSSPVLRQQSQNKIRTDPKPSKPMSASHLSNKDIENKDPGSSAIGKKAPLRAGISRLPVLAKSLHLQTPSDFSQSHCKWEEKPLARKAPKKKPLTRPVPFNLSQPKSTRTAAENQPLADPKLRTHANTKLSKHPTALTGNKDSTKAAGKPLGKTTEDASHLSGPTGPSSTFQISSLSTAMSSLPDNIKRVSLGLFFFYIIEKGENFQPDHAALLSILRNEGVGVTGPAPTTPQSKPYNYLVSWIHSGAFFIMLFFVCLFLMPVDAAVKSVQFSPDPAALQSILQNEGVKAGGPVGTTPRSSVCPPSRATSIYTAQRVPVRKNRPEATAVPTPLNKWTPQRVRNTRHQPLSAMVSMYLLYVGTLSRYPVVLFTITTLTHNASVCRNGISRRTALLDSRVEEKSRTNDDDEEEEEEKLVGEQMFLQAQHRESVIFFSTGKKLFRVPRLEKLGDSALQDQLCRYLFIYFFPVTDLVGQKTCSVSSAVMMLRKRFPPLEELRLDEEVATYTSASVQAPPGFAPLRPSCGNPLASILHFEESTVSISLTSKDVCVRLSGNSKLAVGVKVSVCGSLSASAL
uniref:Uncharacterized protein n=1 Tax=Oreochromis aureus TaxID=47969 RepID=A0A668W1Y8_OREAU